MLTFPFAEGAELRLLEHQHAEELFELIEHSRSFLRRWLPDGDVPKSLEDCRKVIKSSRSIPSINSSKCPSFK